MTASDYQRARALRREVLALARAAAKKRGPTPLGLGRPRDPRDPRKALPAAPGYVAADDTDSDGYGGDGCAAFETMP